MRSIGLKDISAVIYDKETSFKIDAAMRLLAEKRHGVKLQHRWMTNTEGAVAFGRRMLEASSLLARQAEEKGKSVTISDLDIMAKLARSAGEELRRLIKHIVLGTPPRKQPLDVEGKPIPIDTLLSAPLNHMYARNALIRDDQPDIRATLVQAEQDSRILCEASDILQFIEEYGTQTRDAVASDHQNPGSPQKLAFVEGMMRGWIYLTGNKPSEKNRRFSDFVTDAWSDVCDEEFGDCVHAIRIARNKISDFEVTLLAQNGPDWK